MVTDPNSSPWAESSERSSALLTRLRMIKEVADQGYWLSTDEISDLLGVDLSPLDRHSSPSNPRSPESLQWRNFRCVWVGEQQGIDYWTVKQQEQAEIIVSDRPQSPAQIADPPPEEPPVRSSLSCSTQTPTPTQPARFIQLEAFLTPEQATDLMQLVLESEDRFQPTAVSTSDVDYRRSHVLHQQYFSAFSDLITEQIQASMPEILAALNMSSFPLGEIEAQLTSHNHGHYYKIHNDNGSPDTATRELTYVYYFHRHPKGFSGGELRIYDSIIRNNEYQAADTFRLVEPVHNSILFFPSYHLHEVLPIQCPSQQFQDGRFTINGWIRRQTVPTLSTAATRTLFKQPATASSSTWITSLLDTL